MQLSIIIVNYNVKYFLEQCLCSVEKAIATIQAEVFVVDNASTDGSQQYLETRFAWIQYIANTENAGFAKANNLALQKCTGKYVLYLNPDTIVPEECFVKCLSFMEAHTDAGALGIHMVDGSGKFLPESKRSFPSPLISFYKLIGLSSLFPTSKVFAKYSLGNLDPYKNHEVDVLAGAFIMSRKKLLEELNGFDETFFMYGEDIDLSYRIQQAVYKNYYFSESSIIHFKGESTRKGSLNYVRMFYQAMNIFVQKHYGGSSAWFFRLFIKIAIWLRASFSAVAKFILKIGMPLLDTIIIFGAMQMVNHLWIQYVREGNSFTEQLINIALPGFTLVFLAAASLAGIYDKKYKPARAFYSAVFAIIIMLAVYSLLPERFRFSRGVILLGGIASALFITIFRWLLVALKLVDDTDENQRQEQTIIVGTPAEYVEVKRLLNKAGLEDRILGRIAPNGSKEDSLATLSQLPGLLESFGAREIIFCQGHLSYTQIIGLIQQLPHNISARFHAIGSDSIVGSDSKDSSGDFVTREGKFLLDVPYQRRMKRMVDILFGIFILVTFPIQIFLSGLKVLATAFEVIVGNKTWVGYSDSSNNKLPKLPAGVLSTAGLPVKADLPFNMEGAHQLDLWYARHYHWKHDVKLVFKHYKNLNRGTKQ